MTNTSEWRDQAACSAPGVDPEVMFPATMTTAHVATARAICRGCPVKAACLDYALDSEERQGIWGGLTPRERRRYHAGDGTHRDPDGRLRKPCGTDRALRVHRNYGETCDICQEAHEERVRKQRHRLLDEAHARGGTVAGAAVHRRMGEPVCAMCLAAEARGCAERRARRNAELAEQRREQRPLRAISDAA